MSAGQSFGCPITDSHIAFVFFFFFDVPPPRFPFPLHSQKWLQEWQLRGLNSNFNFLKFYQLKVCLLPDFLGPGSNLPIRFLNIKWSQHRKSQAEGIGRVWSGMRGALQNHTEKSPQKSPASQVPFNHLLFNYKI